MRPRLSRGPRGGPRLRGAAGAVDVPWDADCPLRTVPTWPPAPPDSARPASPRYAAVSVSRGTAEGAPADCGSRDTGGRFRTAWPRVPATGSRLCYRTRSTAAITPIPAALPPRPAFLGWENITTARAAPADHTLRLIRTTPDTELRRALVLHVRSSAARRHRRGGLSARARLIARGSPALGRTLPEGRRHAVTRSMRSPPGRARRVRRALTSSGSPNRERMRRRRSAREELSLAPAAVGRSARRGPRGGSPGPAAGSRRPPG